MVTLFFKTKFFLIKEQWWTIVYYYKCPRFALYDLSLGLCTLFFNPYRHCRKFLEKKGVPIVHGYGQTPLRTFSKIAEAAQMTSCDHYLELGSGRGKTCVWASLFIRCQVSGIEWVPLFFSLSKALSILFRLGAHFEQKSMFEVDLEGVTVAYIYSTQLTKRQIKEIPFSSMAPGSRLITISEPHPDFPISKTIPVIFPWGETNAFIQEI